MPNVIEWGKGSWADHPQHVGCWENISVQRYVLNNREARYTLASGVDTSAEELGEGPSSGFHGT
jgi:hypothetical protein